MDPNDVYYGKEDAIQDILRKAPIVFTYINTALIFDSVATAGFDIGMYLYELESSLEKDVIKPDDYRQFYYDLIKESICFIRAVNR